MFDISDEYSQTRDIYLEILREAQKVEDRKLIKMVIQRMKDTQMPLYVAETGSNIIPFPIPFVLPIQPIEELPRQIWPKNTLAHLVAMLTGYLLLIATSSSLLS
ncbi:hypothetical protein QUF80_19870 [Desulfococcaceae bacterium HSG8]|nr:hypothetical protein [Desulfococcaceae bacterium HSG8]